MIRNTIKQNASPKLSSATSFVRKSLGMKTDEHRGALFGIKIRNQQNPATKNGHHLFNKPQ
jgi:hypothetical protein